jgi:hypothetical protein
MQEQPGRERRARPILELYLTGSGDLELAEEAGRRRPDDLLQGVKASRPGSVTSIGGDRRSCRGIDLYLRLDERASTQCTDYCYNDNYFIGHFILFFFRELIALIAVCHLDMRFLLLA